MSRHTITTWLVPAAIACLALAIRFNCLDCYGLWYDEVASVETAQRGIASIFSDRFGWLGNQTPLHYLIVWLTAQPLDPTQSAVLVRLPSAVAGALTALLAYGIGVEAFGRAQGALAGVLLALSPFHTGFSQDLRPYALLTFLVAVSSYALLVAWRTGRAGWWVTVGISTALALLTTNVALVIVLPALAPVIAWMFYRVFVRRASHPQPKRALALMVALIGLVAIASLLTFTGVQRTTFDLALLPEALVTQVTRLLGSFVRAGEGGGLEQAVQWLFALLALGGAAAGLARKRYLGVALCLSMVVVPSLLLALLQTGATVFQRYTLFGLPFYLLLGANGLFAAGDMMSRRTAGIKRAANGAAVVAAAALVGLFVWALASYFNPDLHRLQSYYPDYRGAAGYIESLAGSGDLVIFYDEPALGATVVPFYWRGGSPAPYYDARDPLLFSAPLSGSIFWVVSFFQNDPTFMDWMAAPERRWAGVRRLDRLVIIEEHNAGSVTAAMDRMSQRLEAANPGFQPVKTLRGGIEQAQGRYDQAARLYADAGAYFLLGGEYLRTAGGFSAAGDQKRAWREILIAKFMQPGDADIHGWMSDHLARLGHREAQQEAEVARRLRE